MRLDLTDVEESRSVKGRSKMEGNRQSDGEDEGEQTDLVKDGTQEISAAAIRVRLASGLRVRGECGSHEVSLGLGLK